MAYNDLINRADADSLIPEEVSKKIIQNIPQKSAVMTLARRLPNMSRKQRKMAILDALVTAYFIDGDTGLMQTSKILWKDKYIYAERMGVIVPVPKTVLGDSSYDLWGQVQPRIEEAFGVTFDRAVMYGYNAPSDWPTDLVTGATDAENSLVVGGTGGDLYSDLMSEGGLLSKVETDGYLPSGHIGALTLKGKLRGLRDDVGQPIFTRSMQDKSKYELDGEPIYFPRNGSVDPTTGLLVSGDWNQLVFSIREDIEYQIITEGVISDPVGNIIYNLPQQQMIAIFAIFRLGWQLPNPINAIQQDESKRYPFSILKPVPPAP